MPRDTILGIAFPPADLHAVGCKSCEVRFDSVGALGTIQLSSTALGIQIFPRGQDVRFALDVPPDEAPVIVGAGLSNVTLANGLIAKADMWTRCYLPNDNAPHTLYVRAQAAATNVNIEVF